MRLRPSLLGLSAFTFVFGVSTAGHAGEPIVLFDGTQASLDANWTGYERPEFGDLWQVDADGALHFTGRGMQGPGSNKKQVNLVTREAYGDFDLRFEWKVAEGSNSGVIYRVGLGDKKPYFTGSEYQVLDNDVHKDGKIDSHRAGAIYDMVVPSAEPKAVGEWNSGRIRIEDGLISHYLNGDVVAELRMGTPEWDQKLAESKFSRGPWVGKFMTLAEGHISLQDHNDPVWFRNITIEELD
ncbi:MAG: DUF1080 domain-containing protein [Planctomycetota bacterium]